MQVPNEAQLCLEGLDARAAAGCALVTTTKSFSDAFEDDDTYAYDPDYTGAIILSELHAGRSDRRLLAPVLLCLAVGGC